MLANSRMDNPTRSANARAIFLDRVVPLLLFIMKNKALPRLPMIATNARMTQNFMNRIIP